MFGLDRERSWRVGSLGSPLTFAGQATAAFLERADVLSGPQFFPTMDAAAAAVLEGAIDAGVLTSDTAHTAATETVAKLLAGVPLYIAAEVILPYHCALLGRPGARLADLTLVTGHGSLRQCRRFLAEEVPQARVEIHDQNSVAAAREILDGDGSTGVVATLAVAERFGLEVLARDVDDLSIAGWWLLTADLRISAGADHVAVRASGADELNAVLARSADLKLTPRTIVNAAGGTLFGYRYLVVLRSADAGPIPVHSFAALSAFDVVGGFRSVSIQRPEPRGAQQR